MTSAPSRELHVSLHDCTFRTAGAYSVGLLLIGPTVGIIGRFKSDTVETTGKAQFRRNSFVFPLTQAAIDELSGLTLRLDALSGKPGAGKVVSAATGVFPFADVVSRFGDVRTCANEVGHIPNLKCRELLWPKP